MNKFLGIRIRLWHGLLALGCLGIVLGVTLPSNCTEMGFANQQLTDQVSALELEITELEAQQAGIEQYVVKQLRGLEILKEKMEIQIEELELVLAGSIKLERYQYTFPAELEIQLNTLRARLNVTQGRIFAYKNIMGAIK